MEPIAYVFILVAVIMIGLGVVGAAPSLFFRLETADAADRDHRPASGPLAQVRTNRVFTSPVVGLDTPDGLPLPVTDRLVDSTNKVRAVMASEEAEPQAAHVEPTPLMEDLLSEVQALRDQLQGLRSELQSLRAAPQAVALQMQGRTHRGGLARRNSGGLPGDLPERVQQVRRQRQGAGA